MKSATGCGFGWSARNNFVVASLEQRLLPRPGKQENRPRATNTEAEVECTRE